MRRWSLLVLALLFGMNTAVAAPTPEPDCVVLLHGIGLHGLTMKRLEHALRRAGYRTVNYSYPSRRVTFDALALERLPRLLAEHDVARAPQLHFVAHSLGSQLVRRLIQQQRPANLGRVVMLGPPNQGSPAADHAQRHRLLRAWLGPNLAPLGTGADAISRRLGPADFEVGIIAGTAHLNPLFDRVLSGPHDGVVTVESARLAGMRDFLVVPYSHTGMLWRRTVIEQTLHFLARGEFKHDTIEATREHD